MASTSRPVSSGTASRTSEPGRAARSKGNSAAAQPSLKAKPVRVAPEWRVRVSRSSSVLVALLARARLARGEGAVRPEPPVYLAVDEQGGCDAVTHAGIAHLFRRSRLALELCELCLEGSIGRPSEPDAEVGTQSQRPRVAGFSRGRTRFFVFASVQSHGGAAPRLKRCSWCHAPRSRFTSQVSVSRRSALASSRRRPGRERAGRLAEQSFGLVICEVRVRYRRFAKPVRHSAIARPV